MNSEGSQYEIVCDNKVEVDSNNNQNPNKLSTFTKDLPICDK